MVWNEIASKVLGYFSIGCWLVVFAPQIYENYKRKGGDGVSLLFLYIWILGDMFGLIGAFGQDLIITALILYIYYFLADAVLLTQIHYYNYVNRRHAQTDEADQSEESGLLSDAGRQRRPSHVHHCHCSCHQNHRREESGQQQQPEACGCSPSATQQRQSENNSALTMPAMFPIIAIILVVSLALATWSSDTESLMSGIMSESKSKSKPVKIHPFSQAMGYISAVLFLGARIPQIIKNYRKKSCDGLSISMFIFSILGNMSFTMSLMLYSLDSDYILANIPWILGSTGTLFFDLAIFLQFYWYHGTVETCESTYVSDTES